MASPLGCATPVEAPLSLIPFRLQPRSPRLREGYEVRSEPSLCFDHLNHLMVQCGQAPRSEPRWQEVLSHSAWYFGVFAPDGRLVGFVRVTSDRALNANLWDLVTDPADPSRPEVLACLVHNAITRLRREMGGCSISLSAPPEALQALKQVGFVLDPGGIRAMGLTLRDP